MGSENFARAEEEIANLKNENQNLHNYLEGLGQNMGFSSWFAFGLDLQNVSFVYENGVTHTLSHTKMRREVRSTCQKKNSGK
jgi:hypothetical protein